MLPLDDKTCHEVALVEVALWYHDAIYRPKRKDNELKSAIWAGQFLMDAGLDTTDCQQVHSLIMATSHEAQAKKTLHQLMVDIDLSILGANTPRFNEYEEQIRKEYQWVPWFIYPKKRAALLQKFLSAPRIYNTDLFMERFEKQARKNIQQSIRQLIGS